MIDLTLALVIAIAGSPRVAVLDPTASSVSAVVVDAAHRQVRDAVAREPDIEVVDLECHGAACVEAARGHCDYLLLTRLSARAGETRALVELIDVQSGAVLDSRLNWAPQIHGTATLDLPLLVADVLSVLTVPVRAPTEMEPTAPEVVVSAPVEPEEAAPVEPVARAQPVGLLAPRPEPIPREGVWVGHCVSYPQHGRDVFLDPDDWERYRRHREQARTPLPLRGWIEEQNNESWALNFAWLTPPIVLALGLLVDSSELATLGGGSMPLAAVAAIFDVIDIGSVDECAPR